MVPIVMHHGLFGFGNLKAGPIEFSYFHGIDRAIAGRGHRVILSRVHPTAGIEKRAAQLRETILQQLPFLLPRGGKLLLIAHSLGGLDARYMLSRMGMAEHVGTLLTVCTPHRGTVYADHWFYHLERRFGGMRFLKLLGLDIEALADLTTSRCRAFNEAVPDVPAVRYFSVSAARPWMAMPSFVMHAHRMINQAEGENDGLVSVQSAIWGQHLGIWPADHFHTINRRLAPHAVPRDIAPYYLNALRQIEECEPASADAAVAEEAKDAFALAPGRARGHRLFERSRGIDSPFGRPVCGARPLKLQSV